MWELLWILAKHHHCFCLLFFLLYWCFEQSQTSRREVWLWGTSSEQGCRSISAALCSVAVTAVSSSLDKFQAAHLCQQALASMFFLGKNLF